MSNKSAAVTSRGYKLSYKKKSPTTDSYMPRGGSKVSVCGTCHSVYMNKRWYSENDACAAVVDASNSIKVECPACLKIRDHFPGGIVTLRGDYVLPHKQDLMRLVKNEENRARVLNPLERVMSVSENGGGKIEIATTNEKLAQRLGRSLKKAFHGDVTYRWSHDNKLVRVEWVKG